jgi:hypothetical protein
VGGFVGSLESPLFAQVDSLFYSQSGFIDISPVGGGGNFQHRETYVRGGPENCRVYAQLIGNHTAGNELDNEYLKGHILLPGGGGPASLIWMRLLIMARGAQPIIPALVNTNYFRTLT